MTYKPHHFILENKYTQLLVTQILLLILPTLIDSESGSMLTYIALVSLAVALTLRTFEVQVRTLVFFLMMTVAVGLVEVMLVLLDADYPRISLVLNGFHLGITAMAVVLILRRIFRANVITGDSIRGGICVYFLVGYSFFFIYRMLLDYYPHSFSKPMHLDGLFSLLYFSFTTLTSVGYGDITPTTPFGMAIANLEAIFGQMYSAIVMARLVSQYLNSRSGNVG
ncbi:potassium channel family protein [Parathermosynechococcus lividus]